MTKKVWIVKKNYYKDGEHHVEICEYYTTKKKAIDRVHSYAKLWDTTTKPSFTCPLYVSFEGFRDKQNSTVLCKVEWAYLR